MGTLYYGDNLEILRRYLKDDTVDLVYLDPPFNSAQNYNAFFHEKDGTDAASQIRAFEGIWHWGEEAARLQGTTEPPENGSDVTQPFKIFSESKRHHDCRSSLAGDRIEKKTCN
jgi:adenine specific DNA methylase Mod